ncbi:DNA-binding IclR family transcriptional regulator [Arthrobacter sp. 1088]|uniref:IclR family transcriptional regulator n=1 Tax=Arthrobacter sp. 1088 TaxID=2817768 RepID=UPI0028592232|nr:IclR family transcriptional regulator [Arthrobacter sp. 1088]MDR6687719.1 DNA-binding IclR family transcriptional regulator [Arthrobacter sp. 1088]
MADPRTLSTVQRTLEVLKAFTAERPEWGVTELATRVGAHKSQIHRAVATLSEEGFLVPNPATRKYRLGPALVRLGIVAGESGGIPQLVQPVLEQLAHEVGETTVFNLAREHDYVMRAAADGPGQIRFALTLGRSYPWYGGAGGHAIFAYRSEEQISALLDGGFNQATLHGPHSREQILERHRVVKDQGYAVSEGEFDERIMAVGVPVRLGSDVIGSICIVGVPALLHGREEQLGTELLNAASALSDRLSSAGPGIELN